MSEEDLDEECGDEHCCSAHIVGDGYCDICGAIIYGTMAYCDAYGCDPSER